MTVGLLQLTRITPGADCLEITLDQENSEKLRSQTRPVTVLGRIASRPPLSQKGEKPAAPTYFRIKSGDALREGYAVGHFDSKGSYELDHDVEFEII